MSSLQKVVYLNEEQRGELFEKGSITVDGKTVTYSDDDLYITNESSDELNEVIEIGSYQYSYEGKILPAIPVGIAREVYTKDKAGNHLVLHWTLYGTENNLKIVSSDLIAGTYSIDLVVHNQYHCAYEWTADTTGNINPKVEKGGTGGGNVDDVRINDVSIVEDKIANIEAEEAQTIDIDSEVTSESTNLITSGAVYNALSYKILPIETSTIELSNNTEYRANELSSLEITLKETIENDFISSVIFTSGETPTSFNYPANIKWSGDDVTNEIFVPIANKRYTIMFYYDGININGVSRGI